MVTVALLGMLILLFQHIFLHYTWRQQKKVNMRRLMKSKKKEEKKCTINKLLILIQRLRLSQCITVHTLHSHTIIGGYIATLTYNQHYIIT